MGPYNTSDMRDIFNEMFIDLCQSDKTDVEGALKEASQKITENVRSAILWNRSAWQRIPHRFLCHFYKKEKSMKNNRFCGLCIDTERYIFTYICSVR